MALTVKKRPFADALVAGKSNKRAAIARATRSLLRRSQDPDLLRVRMRGVKGSELPKGGNICRWAARSAQPDLAGHGRGKNG
jgi:hypothetical protein